MTDKMNPVFWLAPMALVLLALLPWPYGYYMFLRIAMCLSLGIIAFYHWNKYETSIWPVILGLGAILYNPVLPIHLDREIWVVLNVLTAVVLGSHLLWDRKNPRN